LIPDQAARFIHTLLCVSVENFKAVCEVKCGSPVDSTEDYRDFIRYSMCRKIGEFIDGI